MGESPTLTIRIDEATKKRLEEEAKKSDQSITEYVARAVKMRWEGACQTCGRDMGAAVVQTPGMSAAFTAWAEQQTSRPSGGGVSQYVTLVTNEPTGNRLYTGNFYSEGVHSSYITLSLERPHSVNDPFLIPVMRQFIVAWQSNEAAQYLRDRLVMYFRYADMAMSVFPQLMQERLR